MVWLCSNYCWFDVFTCDCTLIKYQYEDAVAGSRLPKLEFSLDVEFDD